MGVATRDAVSVSDGYYEDVFGSEFDDDESEDATSVEQRAHFQRVDSRVRVTSRRSALTLALTKADRGVARRNRMPRPVASVGRLDALSCGVCSVSSSSVDECVGSVDTAATEVRGAQGEHLRCKSIRVGMSSGVPIPCSRIVRREMLERELYESLRLNILWERQQVSSVWKAASDFKSRETVSGEKYVRSDGSREVDSRVCKESFGGTGCCVDYFSTGLLEYHERGW